MRLEHELHYPFASMKRKNHICTLDLTARQAPARLQPVSQKRLVQAFSCLERLELERACRQDPVFCKFLEERIISREEHRLESVPWTPYCLDHQNQHDRDLAARPS